MNNKINKRLINFILIVFLILINNTLLLKSNNKVKLDEKISSVLAHTINPGGTLLNKVVPFANYEKKRFPRLNKYNLNSNEDVLNMTYLDLMRKLKRNNN
jgi:hypothetical protein